MKATLQLFGILFVVFVMSAATFADDSIPFDGMIKYGKNYVSQLETERDVITRNNNISINLKNLYLVIPKTTSNKVYVQLTIKGYSLQNGTLNKNEPVIAMSKLFKETITGDINNQTVQRLSEKNLAYNIPLSQINDIEITVRIARCSESDTKTQDKLDKFLGEIIVGSSALRLLNELMMLGSEQQDLEKLLYSCEFNIPLNSIEAKTKIVDKASVLKRNQTLPIILDAEYKTTVLNDKSMAGNIISGLSALVGRVVGVADLDKINLKAKGIMEISFVTTDNPLLPPLLLSKLNEIYTHTLSGNEALLDSAVKDCNLMSTQLFSSDPSQSHVADTLFLYLQLIDYNRKAPSRTDPKFESWYESYKNLFTQFIFHYKNLNFKVFGASNIYRGKTAIIFVPYSLDERTTIEFIRLQVGLHEKLAKADQSYWLVSE